MDAIYTINIAGTGEVIEVVGDMATVERRVSALLDMDASDLVSSDWCADGGDDEGRPLERRLYWSSETDADDDDGARSACSVVRYRQD